MTREEQLKFCSVCQHRKMDMGQGLICELTNAKADFEEKCENYLEDAEKKQKEIRIEQEFQESLSISGWLAFFLFVGVGFGAVISCIIGFFDLQNVGLTLLGTSLYLAYYGCLLVTAILTIVAFYRRSTNAVSLAYTYIAMIFIDVIMCAYVYYIFNDSATLMMGLRSLIWAGIWCAYLALSSRVENLIPRKTRTWKLPEKILLGIYTTAVICLCMLTTHDITNISEPVLYDYDDVTYDSELTEKDIDYGIQIANWNLDELSTPEMTCLGVFKENDMVVYSFTLNDLTESMDDSVIEYLEEVYNAELLNTMRYDATVREELQLYFDAGYDVCYRYHDAWENHLFDVVINQWDL